MYKTHKLVYLTADVNLKKRDLILSTTMGFYINKQSIDKKSMYEIQALRRIYIFIKRILYFPIMLLQFWDRVPNVLTYNQRLSFGLNYISPIYYWSLQSWQNVDSFSIKLTLYSPPQPTAYLSKQCSSQGFQTIDSP